MSKLALASLCAGLLSCAAQQAEYYIDQLDDSRRQVRLDASHALVQLGSAAVEPLLDRATAGSDSLRYIAAQILGQIGDRRATPPSSNRSSATKTAMSANRPSALSANSTTPRLHTILASVLADDSVPDVRGAAAWSLGNLRDTTAVPSLVRALADTIPSVRRQALAALQFLWTSEAEAAALASLRDRDDNVRYIAAQLLGHHRTHRALDALCLALTDDNIWVPRRKRPHPRPHRRHHSREAARAHVRRARRSRPRGRQRGIASAHGPKLRGRPLICASFRCFAARCYAPLPLRAPTPI